MAKTNSLKKGEFIVTEHGGPEKLEELILEPLVKYINECAGTQIVKIRIQNEPPIFEKKDK
ncbi:hypothetical protein [Desulfolucanica intricata]|uniref:hypothetical protein n=1 Tax=Desulfolucanica intricata TaxID=1285191 RepID=UPI00082F9D49|nr:hypothetical protein [Desulfolucanica intricata]